MVTHSRDWTLARLGVLVAAAVVSFAALFLYTTNRTLNAGRADIWVVFPAADGLRKGDAVLYRGVTVGQVRSIDFDGDGSVITRVRLVRPVPVSRRAGAALVAADMFGRQTVVLSDGAAAPPLASGDTLRGAPQSGLASRVDGVAGQIERLVSDSTIDALHTVIARVELAMLATTEMLQTSGRVVERSGAGLDRVLDETAGVAANLRALTDSTQMLELRTALTGSARHLAAATARLDTASFALTRTASAVAEGEGTLGRLLGDPELYERAMLTLAGVDSLISDVKRQPKRYINLKVF